MKPLLASTVDVENLESLSFPLIASPKFDGIRCLITKDGGVTRNLKPIPNKNIREMLDILTPYALDGELVSGDTFQSSTSFIMSHEKEGEFEYHIFDIWNSDKPFNERFKKLVMLSHYFPTWVKIVPHKVINNIKELLEFEEWCLNKGYEGVMLRNPNGLYKFGRSTNKEGILMKLKRFTDSEALIIGMEPLYKNTNEAVTNALGRSERSTKKEGKVEQDTLGAVVVEWNGIVFSIGSGFNPQVRDELWKRKSSIIGKKYVKFKYQESGVKEAPRFPVFLGIRDKRDI